MASNKYAYAGGSVTSIKASVFNSDDPKAILIKQSEKLRDLIKKLETQNNKLREFSEKSQKFNSLSEDMSSSSTIGERSYPVQCTEESL